MNSAVAIKSVPEREFEPESSLFERLGGRDCLDRVHKALYDKIFVHPVFGVFFEGKDQTHQQDQQSDFMAMIFGGPKRYCGRMPRDAHQHLFITREMFELRQRILAKTLEECGVAPELRELWLAADRRFESQIVKDSVGDCRKRYNTDTIIVAPGVAPETPRHRRRGEEIRGRPVGETL